MATRHAACPAETPMIRRILLAPLVFLAGCDGPETLRVPEGAPPAAAQVAPGMATETLEAQLQTLAAELERAQEGELERLLTAEAVTDQLMHARRSVDWLAIGYDVEARLRQLQAMADRVVARLRRGETLTGVDDDVRTMRAAVEDLQAHLARPGGGEAPPSLDSLLLQDPLRDAQSDALADVEEVQDTVAPDLPDIDPQVSPAQSGPLGRPVPDTDPDG